MKTGIAAEGVAVQHARLPRHANTPMTEFFFFSSRMRNMTPRTASDLKKIGRDVLASLLDPQDSTDQKRIAMLQSDPAWAGG